MRSFLSIKWSKAFLSSAVLSHRIHKLSSPVDISVQDTITYAIDISCSVGADIHNSPLSFNQESDNYDLSCGSLEENMVFNDQKEYAFHQDFDASEDQTKLNTMTTLSTKITVIHLHLHHCVKKVSSLYLPLLLKSSKEADKVLLMT